MTDTKPHSTMKTCWSYKADNGVCIVQCVETPPDDFTTQADQALSHKLAVHFAQAPETGNPPDPACRQPGSDETTTGSGSPKPKH